MDALGLNALSNIIYRMDELPERIEFLHRITVRGDVDLQGFNELIKKCNIESVEQDAKRKSGGRRSW